MDGTVTHDNHSLSIANIAMHYVILPISDALNKAVIFKRFIDDIVWHSNDRNSNSEIQNALKEQFEKHDLCLTFWSISTSEPGQTLEFLDVLHETNTDTNLLNYVTRDFTKETATKDVLQTEDHITLCQYVKELFLVKRSDCID